MTTAQIVENDKANTDMVHLYREGIFLKAYNRSAFLFQKHFRNFRAVKKFFKSVGEEVVMLGFPSANLPSVFPDKDFENGDGSYICIPSPGEFNDIEYSLWFESVQMAPEKPKKTTRKTETIAPLPQVTLFETFVRKPDLDNNSVIGRVVDELEAFSIENSTPMECMMFLSRLKTELKKGKSGGI